jgi:uncharacterized protein
MRTFALIFLGFITATCFAAPIDCYKLSNEPKQRVCLHQQVRGQKEEMKRLERLIDSSPVIPQRDKQILRKDQSGWEKEELSVCGGDPYCTNSELEHRINDLSAYLASYNKSGK